MEIFIEQTLIVSFFQNAFILNLTAFFIKEKAKFWFLTSLLAAVLTLFVPLFALGVAAKILLQFFVATLVTSFSFPVKNLAKFFFSLGVFVVFTFIFGGACFAAEQTFGDYPLFIVCLIGLVVFVLSKVLIFYHNRLTRLKAFTYKVVIKANGKAVEESGYLDSGNVLLDNITKSPIILINFEVFKRLYQDISLVSLLAKQNMQKLNCVHYVKINSVGSGSKILAFVVDEIQLNGDKVFKNPTLALSFSGFEKSFKANVLLNSQMVFGG